MIVADNFNTMIYFFEGIRDCISITDMSAYCWTGGFILNM